jgi:hypothetical protein
MSASRRSSSGLAKSFDGERWLLVEGSGGTIVAMNLNQLANGVFMGCFLVILGLVPGLLYWISDQLQQVGKSFSPSLLDASRRQGMPYGGLPRPLWLAGLGIALIFASIIAYEFA